MGSQEAGTVPVLRLCKSTCLDLRSCLGSDNIARPILIFANRQTVRGNVSVKGETGLRWGLEERFGAGTNLGHSEGESLLEGKKKRLGRNNSPQNGRFGGRATSCEGSEEQTIDQARILGGPDNSLVGPGRRGIS